MKILLTPDVPDWAIGMLGRSIVRHASHRFNFDVQYVHPREVTSPSLNIKEIIKAQGNYDLWCSLYWRSGQQMLDIIPELEQVPKVLAHMNHNSLEADDWSKWDAITISTVWGEDKLKQKYGSKVKRIPYGIDLDRFSYISERKDDGKTVGYVGRVIEHKHLKDVCDVAYKVGAHVLGSGYIEKKAYWGTVDKAHLDWNGGEGRQGMSPTAFKDNLYEKMTVFVMYSSDEKESGTLPLLEAMARGIPVMATSQGMARDLISHGENGIIFTPETFEKELKELLENRELQERLRSNAWSTIKGYNEVRYSRRYQRLFAETLSKGKPLLSIIIPTYNRPELLIDSLARIEAQNYPYAEVLICDDGSDDPKVEQVITHARKTLRTPVIHLKQTKDGYGLARARNMGIREAIGDILIFLDDRMGMDMESLDAIAKSTIAEKHFYFGQKVVDGKPSTKRSFIENFSWCKRQDIIDAGMFPEWLKLYGGMSQEIRTRLVRQGWTFDYAPQASCTVMAGSARDKKKDEIWKAKQMMNEMYG